jgi:two-component sensor histidine kinase
MTVDPSPFADLSGLSRMNFGTHYSHFFEDGDDLAEAVVPFIATGLYANEKCLWVTSDPFRRDQAVAALARKVPDLAERMAGGQVEIIEHTDWYTANGSFDAATVIDGWMTRERAALAAGYDALRITGNTFWLDTPQDFRDFADYEAELHRRLKGHRIVCLCSYCISKCSGADLLDVIRNHDFAMVRRHGSWDIVESASVKVAKGELVERLARKEQLLSEIHHRVKNNLQIVSSLLTLKAADFGGPGAAAALEDTLARISAMGLIHQMLYEQDDGGAINFPVYLDRLSRQLSVAYDCGERIRIEVEADRASAPMIKMDAAMPLGIAVAEAITNAIKHAFPDRRAGRVRIGVVASGRGEMAVSVRDDGCGCAPDRLRHHGGSGLGLIKGLVRQVDGRAEVFSGDGFEIRFVVPVA